MKLFLVASSNRLIVINIKSLIMDALVTMERGLKVPIVAVFYNLGIFRAVYFGTSR